MRSNDFLCNSKSKSDAGYLIRTGNSKKALQYPRLKFLLNTRSVIDDRKPYGVASRLDKELNFVARPRESRRVGNKVRKDVPYLARINRNVRKIRRNAGNQPQVIGFNQQAEVRQDIFNRPFG